MEGERTRNTSRNMTWTPAMTEFILKYLAEEIRAGQKNQNGFKACVLSDAAEAANKKFGKKMMFCHVQNHLKTVKKRWRRIEYMKSMNGATFLPDTNTIEMQYEVYHKHVEAHPGDEQFINKPIKHYEEMRIVCGNDSATEVESKSNKEPLNSPHNVNLVDPNSERNGAYDEVQLTPNSTPSRSKKRKNDSETEMEYEDTLRGRKLHHARWSPIMSKFLLTYLVGETKAGHKGSTGFKAIAMHNAAEAITKKFGKTVTSCHVQNHLRTLKKYWSIIQRIKKTSGAIFNSDANTLQMGLEDYQKYIEAHSGDDQFINKPIKHYTEMEIVCGNDHIVELGAIDATYNPCEPSSTDANLDSDDIGVDKDDVPLLTHVYGGCDDDDDDDDDDDNDQVDDDGGGDGDADDETTSSGSRKRKKSGQTEENLAPHVERMAGNVTSKQNHNMRWNSELTDFLLIYLAEQAQRGNKGSTGFKACVLNRAVHAINEKFGKKMLFSNVQNHLKTVRRWWKRIQFIKSLSGVTFHPDINTLEMGHEEYQEHVQAYPGDEPFINKPIKMFSQLEIIYASESKVVNSGEVKVATNAESPSVNLCTNENKEDQDEPQSVTPIAINLVEANLAANDETEQQSRTSSGARKRKRSNETKQNLTNFVSHMAIALKELSTDKTVRFAKDIMAELRTIQSEFSCRALRKAQRFLVENSLDGSCFISYNRDEKVAWMQDFVDEHLGGNAN